MTETNQLLAMLPAEALACLSKHLIRVEKAPGDILASPGEEIRTVYFPRSGIVSFQVDSGEGDFVQTAMVGRDGVIGAAQAIDGKISVNKIVVQAAMMAASVDRDPLREAMRQSPAIRSVLAAHEQFFVTDIQQTVACNAAHEVEARMGRWLLRMMDLVGKDLTLTQENLAAMIGSTRSSVTHAALAMQDKSLIQYSRGNIRIQDPSALTKASCGCHEAVRRHYETLLGASWPRSS